MNDHLLLIDGLNLIRRVYGANPAPDSDEKAQGALKSSHSSFTRAIRDHSPTHCLWTFDHPEKTWRHEKYPEYKAGRKPMPEPLQAALPSYKQMLADKGWALATFPGFEAEDTMASAAAHARGLGMAVTALSNDKDVLCLAEYGVTIYDHFARATLDDAHCLRKFGVPAHQVIEVLALLGDATDGVPGVAGVGLKTAAKLIMDYGSVEGVLAAAHAIPGKLGLRLLDQAGIARLSRELVELRFDVFKAAGRVFDPDEFVLGQF